MRMLMNIKAKLSAMVLNIGFPPGMAKYFHFFQHRCLISFICLGLLYLLFLNHFFMANSTKNVKLKLFLEKCDKFSQQTNCSSIFSQSGNSPESRLTPPTDFDSKSLDLLKDIVLVVHFNAPHFESAAKVDVLYRPFFADIIYCVPTSDLSQFWPSYSSSNSKNKDISELLKIPNAKVVNFEQPGKDVGQLAYQCSVNAFDTFRDTFKTSFKGILQIADDLMLNFWNLKLNENLLSKVWMMDPGERQNLVFSVKTAALCENLFADDNNGCNLKSWIWSEDYKRQCNRFLEHLAKLVDGNVAFDRKSKQFWQQFRTNLTNITKGKNRLIGRSGGDIFYIPKHFIDKTFSLFRLFAMFVLSFTFFLFKQKKHLFKIVTRCIWKLPFQLP